MLETPCLMTCTTSTAVHFQFVLQCSLSLYIYISLSLSLLLSLGAPRKGYLDQTLHLYGSTPPSWSQHWPGQSGSSQRCLSGYLFGQLGSGKQRSTKSSNQQSSHFIIPRKGPIHKSPAKQSMNPTLAIPRPWHNCQNSHSPKVLIEGAKGVFGPPG